MADLQPLEDLALGADEAACVMGVQRSRPKKMHERGEIVAKVLAPVWSESPSRGVRIFSLDSCEQNFREFEDRKQIKGRGGVMRPREYLDYREPALQKLRELKPRILFEDAIGTAQAAEELMVTHTYITKLCQSGDLVARKPATDQSKKPPRFLIISRASCKQFLRDNWDNPPKYGRPRVRKTEFSEARREYCENKKRKHKEIERRMRSQGLIREKKRFVWDSTGALECEVCEFDFFRNFGALGRKYAHAHHKVWLSVSNDERVSTIDDLAIVCPNCHAMLHRADRKGRWKTVEELRVLWQTNNANRRKQK